MKLLALATHPIQYQAPWFRRLAQSPGVDLFVAFGLLPTAEQQGVGFDVPFTWDLDLLGGYRSTQLELAGRTPALDHFFGLRARGLRNFIKQCEPDALILSGWNSFILTQGLLAARLLQVPILMRCEANDLRTRRPLVRWLQRAVLRQTDASLAIGGANREFLKARGVRDRQIFSAPYFVDNGWFLTAAARLEPERNALRTEFGFSADCLVALFVGKLIEKKRPGDLIAAAAQARRAGADIEVLFAGDGALRPVLEEAARALGVPVRFAGFLNQAAIPRAYVAADLLVLPSDAGETWGLVVNEAMACSRPAIVSDQVGCRTDLVHEGKTGWSFRCGEVTSLAARLTSSARDRTKLHAMGIRARDHVLANYSVEHAVAGTLAAANSVVRSRNGTR